MQTKAQKMQDGENLRILEVELLSTLAGLVQKGDKKDDIAIRNQVGNINFVAAYYFNL
jgi:hypothetical protein